MWGPVTSDLIYIYIDNIYPYVFVYNYVYTYIYIYIYEHLYLPKPFRRLVQRAVAFSGSQVLLSFQAIQLRLEPSQLIQDLWRNGARNLDGFSKKNSRNPMKIP